eukprot:m.12097 g.12097  ORF g.12097 m.12097 type:complete len:207 (-) comp6079_c0_seq1:272-892(-)
MRCTSSAFEANIWPGRSRSAVKRVMMAVSDCRSWNDFIDLLVIAGNTCANTWSVYFLRDFLRVSSWVTSISTVSSNCISTSSSIFCCLAITLNTSRNTSSSSAITFAYTITITLIISHSPTSIASNRNTIAIASTSTNIIFVTCISSITSGSNAARATTCYSRFATFVFGNHLHAVEGRPELRATWIGHGDMRAVCFILLLFFRLA